MSSRKHILVGEGVDPDHGDLAPAAIAAEGAEDGLAVRQHAIASLIIARQHVVLQVTVCRTTYFARLTGLE